MSAAPRPWDHLISEEEKKAYRAAGFGRPTGIGQRPALLIIDVQYRTTGTERRPFWDSIKEFPTACGEPAWDAIANIAKLLALFRERGCTMGLSRSGRAPAPAPGARTGSRWG